MRVQSRAPLDRRLHAAGVALDTDPVEAWRRLRTVEGPAATIIDQTHSASRNQYAQAKRSAAALWADDGLAYTDTKTEVVQHILEQAAQG